MKSRKFKAVLAAISAIAVLATAMTGFAAANISTVTKYNLADATKASVVTTVTLDSKDDAEVTLLVKSTDENGGVSDSGIAYIDQKAASSGQAVFTYQLAKSAVGNATQAAVISGNDANEGTAKGELGVTALEDVNSAAYTIKYDQDAYGAGDDKVTASITAVGANEITSVVIGDETYPGAQKSYDVPVTNGVLADIVVTTNPTETTVDIAASGLVIDNKSDTKSAITVIKVTGETTGYEIGVNYKGYTFPAAGTVKNGFIAVQLTNNKDFVEDDISVYCTPKTSAEK